MRASEALRWSFKGPDEIRIKNEYFLTKKAYSELKRRYGLQRANLYIAQRLKFMRLSVKWQARQEKYSRSHSHEKKGVTP